MSTLESIRPFTLALLPAHRRLGGLLFPREEAEQWRGMRESKKDEMKMSSLFFNASIALRVEQTSAICTQTEDLKAMTRLVEGLFALLEKTGRL